MKKFYIAFLLVSLVGIQACDDILPDVNTKLSKTFTITLTQSNSGSSVEEIMDISAANEYNEFKNTVKGYELEKITYKVTNSNVPNDMYFTGSIICKKQDGTQPLTAASITKANIAAAADSTSEIDVTENMADVATILGWLESEGKFKVNSSFALTNAQNAPYTMTTAVIGKTFNLTLSFYIIVKTGV